MNLPTRLIPLGFYAAAFVNIAGVLLFSQLYSNGLMSSLYPAVFSNFGLICIQLWGLAYWAVAKHWVHVPALIAVFAVEKLAYAVSWLQWMDQSVQQLPTVWSASPLTATFYLIYGPTDFAFGLFFVLVALQARRMRQY